MQRNGFIDTVKGILIILVILLHFSLEPEIQKRFLFPFWADMSVPCFVFLSGYVSALSFQKREIRTFEDAYRWNFITEKLLRYTIPYTIAFAAEWIVFRIFGLYTVGIREYGILASFLDYIRGGKGQGSYYFPILIQFVFLFPVIFFVIKKYDQKGLLYCLAANAVFEVMKTAYGMNGTEYRLLILRYLFIAAAGCYAVVGRTGQDKRTRWFSGISIVVGLAFIYLFSYTGYEPKIILYWKSTSFLTCLFIAPILGWMVSNVSWSFRPLQVIGKASFHIFLVQMIYYNFADRMYALILDPIYGLIFNIVNCVAAGTVFYFVERPLSRKMIEKLKSANKV